MAERESTNEVDLYDLLRKYMKHVQVWEGVTFLGIVYSPEGSFNEDELSILTCIAEELS